MKYDIAIIGGGIVGLATAKALLEDRPQRKLVVVEAEGRVGAHQTGHNSGVIHSGLYYKPGSLRARTCVEGRDAMYRFCRERGIAHERCGKIVVATRTEELPRLEELYRRGTENGLAGMRRLRPEEIREHEPYAVGVGGLYVGETGIVDYKAVARELAAAASELGGEVKLHARVAGCAVSASEIVLKTTAGDFHADAIVNCGGLWSDRIARLCGWTADVRIVPFRGEYYELAPERRFLVRNLIYPVPDPAFPFLGVHFTRTVGGGIEAGPNAVLALKRAGYRKTDFSFRDAAETLAFPGFWKLAGKYWKTGLGEMWRSLHQRAFVAALQKLVPELKPEDVRPAGAGVRAQAMDFQGNLLDDFRVVRMKRMIHVLNAPSPAATASLSIGKTIAAIAREEFH